MKKRIFRSILAVSMTILALTLLLVVSVLHNYFETRVLGELENRTAYIQQGVELDGMAYLADEDIPADSRITWVAADGTVLFDNWEDPASMDDHSQREEIREAMEVGEGRATRYSDTRAEETLYYARRLSDGTVIRVSDTNGSVWAMVLQALQPMILVVVLALVLGLWLANRLARQLMAPINAFDLNKPEGDAAYEELEPLLDKIRSQHGQIQAHILELKQRQEEFAAITEHMSEGFLVIDPETRILTYNSAALRLLYAETPVKEVMSIYALNGEAGFRRCVEGALTGRRTEQLLERGDSCLQIIASPVEQGEQLTGAVVVILDVTEKEQREQLRREFTANVSHELKTPLTSILGTAEIIENGFVKPEDTAHFAGNIRREARRLIELVNDIIKLSRLDEGGQVGEWESVDLYEKAWSVLHQLEQAALRKGVSLELRGECAVARGVPQILEEIIYNLCDNAVAYNRENGRVTVVVEDSADGAVVTVEDTGIGIPPEARQRVFERFYRVDKSHSTGGTGLGLSIVKHGAAYLGVQIAMESEVGRGTKFTLRFPKA